MKSPPFLKPGNTIGIVAPARKISEKEVSAAIEIFQGWGLQVALGKNLFGSHDQFSGSDSRRAEDLQYMLDHPDIHAVICARGGYGTVRIIDLLDFSTFRKKPKWIAGFSDITALHAHINHNFGTETIHSMMPVNMVRGKKMIPRAEALESLRKALFGEKLSYTIAPHPLNKPGKASGTLVGGNISVLYSLSGSSSDLSTRGRILFLEDLDEYLYHMDRMVMNFERAGKFANLSGLVIGGMTEMRDNNIPFGKTAEQIISGMVSKYPFPVCFSFPAGHLDDNRALIMGREVHLKVTRSSARLEFS